MNVTTVVFALMSFGAPIYAQTTCGRLETEFVDEITSYRRTDEDRETWVLVSCDLESPSNVKFTWIAFDSSSDAWTGGADWAVWSAAEVENGCANNDSIFLGERDVICSRRPLLDDNGNQQMIFGVFPAWVYSLVPASEIPDGQWYFGARILIEGRSSFSAVPFVPECLPDEIPFFFQSDFLDFPCAVPGREIIGGDNCVAVVIEKVNCNLIQRFKVKCQDAKLKTRIKSSLPAGTELNIDNDGDVKAMVIDERGRGKVKWRRQTGPHTVCILECPDMCETTDCGG